MKKTRYEELRAAYEKFDEENPNFYVLFKKFTFELIARGFKHYSAQHGVFARIRWETDFADAEGRPTFKVNNNFSAFYARRFMKDFPEHSGFYRLRHQTSIEAPAVNLPELTPEDFPEVTS